MTNELLQRADRAISESEMLIAQREEIMWKAEQLDHRLFWIHYQSWAKIHGRLYGRASRRYATVPTLRECVAMLNVLHLDRIKIIEKFPSSRSVVALSGKLRDPILLLGNMSLAQGNVPLRFFEMAKVHRAITSSLRTE
jgi:hypothetical protein